MKCDFVLIGASTALATAPKLAQRTFLVLDRKNTGRIFFQFFRCKALSPISMGLIAHAQHVLTMVIICCVSKPNVG